MKIRVDGIGPRKRYWIIRSHRSTFGPFLSLEALAWGLRHYCGYTDVGNLQLLGNCIRGEGPRYQFDVYHTGLAIGSHREDHRGETSPQKPSPEDEVSSDVQELLDALGPEPEPPTAMALLRKTLGQHHADCSRSDLILRGADFSGFSTRHVYDLTPFCLRLDLSGDFSWSKFDGAYIYSIQHLALPQGNSLRARRGMVYSNRVAKQTEVVLSGLFVGASFQKAKISYARLGGDFARADFRKARLNGCLLSGKFHGALLRDMDLSACSIDPEASFAGADLRGACGLFCSQKQLVAAHVRSTDRVVVKTGAKIELVDREYELCFPAQFLGSVRIADAIREPAEPSRKGLPVSLLEGDPTQDEFSEASFLYDVVGMGLTRLEGGSAPVLKTRGAFWDFRLNAPGVSLANFKAVRHKVYLTGNFDEACLKDSQIGFLSLRQGSFKKFDLTNACVECLELRMAPTDLSGLRFPTKLTHVRLDCFRERTHFPLRVTTGTASEIISAWNSPAECGDLAKGILQRVKSLSGAMRQQLLCASGCTPFSLLGDLRPRGKLAIVVAILMRKNQMLLNSIRLAARHGNPSSLPGCGASR